MSIYGGPDLITDRLIIHLDAANNKSYPGSGTVWNNTIASSNNATLINGVTYSPNNNGTFNFDGLDDRADIAYSSTNFINVNFTWSVWILGTVNNNGPMPIIGYGSGAWPRLGWRLNTNWTFSQYDNLGPGLDISFGLPSTTSWLNLTLVANYTNTRLQAYRNGTLITTLNNWKASSGNSGNLGLGRAGSTSWPNALLIGSLGPFMVYNKALTALEVSQNYNAMKGRFSL